MAGVVRYWPLWDHWPPDTLFTGAIRVYRLRWSIFSKILTRHSALNCHGLQTRGLTYGRYDGGKEDEGEREWIDELKGWVAPWRGEVVTCLKCSPWMLKFSLSYFLAIGNSTSTFCVSSTIFSMKFRSSVSRSNLNLMSFSWLPKVVTVLFTPNLSEQSNSFPDDFPQGVLNRLIAWLFPLSLFSVQFLQRGCLFTCYSWWQSHFY